ncbi:single-stranded DNA-binding protein [Erythrobacter aureus]|nr:single-stranded DNA-binding protein [Erythrobacter aureus]
MNRAILVGTVVSQPNLIELKNNSSITKFRLQTTDVYHVDGDLRERSQTHLIDVWNAQLQKDVTPGLQKGDFVSIEGAIESRKVTGDDGEKWVTSIVIRNNGAIQVFAPGSNVSTRGEAGDYGVNVDHRRKPEDAGEDAGDNQNQGDEEPMY